MARLRLREARVLQRAGLSAGAYYLAGYAVECGLKACIAKQTRRHDFPEKQMVNDAYTHDVSKLVRVAGLQVRLDAATQASPAFNGYWAIVKDWNESARYDDTITRQKALDLYRAITDVQHGVMKWIRQHW